MREAMPPLNPLHVFEITARLGSFTKAADRVFKTQSAVSMQMRRLEERIGKPIFVRDGRAFDDVRPGIEAMPDGVEMLDLVLG